MFLWTQGFVGPPQAKLLHNQNHRMPGEEAGSPDYLVSRCHSGTRWSAVGVLPPQSRWEWQCLHPGSSDPSASSQTLGQPHWNYTYTLLLSMQRKFILNQYGQVSTYCSVNARVLAGNCWQSQFYFPGAIVLPTQIKSKWHIYFWMHMLCFKI